MGILVKFNIELSDVDVVLFGQCIDEMKRRLTDLSIKVQSQITAQEIAVSPKAENVVDFARGPSPELNLSDAASGTDGA